MKNGRMTRTVIVALCALVFIGFVTKGTMAYFSYTPDPTVNTFVAGDILKSGDEFVLKEHKALDEDGDGEFELDETVEVTENKYVVMPGIEIPKDPFVKTSKELVQNAYVFIEVVDDLKGDATDGVALTYEVDDAKWAVLSGATGKHGGTVYVYAVNNGLAAKGSVFGPVNILEGDKITVATDKKIPNDVGTLSFYGYMIQAEGFTSAEDAWTKGFTGTTAG